MQEPQQSKSIADQEAVSELDSYRRQRKEQLLAQCNDILNLRADVNRRKLTYIINHAVTAAFM